MSRMDYIARVLLVCLAVTCVVATWPVPYHPRVHRSPVRVTRYAPLPHRHRIPVRHPEPIYEQPSEPARDRPKREKYEYDEEKPTNGVTGPVHTFVKTDKNANYKWGVRHHVGNKYAS